MQTTTKTPVALDLSRLTEDQRFGVEAIRAMDEWMGSMPDTIPSRAADALFETYANNREAIASANGIASAMGDVAEANDEMDDTSDEFWALVVAALLA